jgi:hypothetical protein
LDLLIREVKEIQSVKRKKNPNLIRIKVEFGDASIKLTFPRRWLLALALAAFEQLGLWLGG